MYIISIILCTYILVLLFLAGHESNTEHQFLGVVIVEDAVEVLTKVSADLVSDLLHRQFLVGHPLSIQFQTKEPRGDTGHIEVRHFIIDVDELLIFCDDCVLRLRVIVDRCVRSDLTKSGVLNSTENILRGYGIKKVQYKASTNTHTQS
jgi:hypothetical protein